MYFVDGFNVFHDNHDYFGAYCIATGTHVDIVVVNCFEDNYGCFAFFQFDYQVPDNNFVGSDYSFGNFIAHNCDIPGHID